LTVLGYASTAMVK